MQVGLEVGCAHVSPKVSPRHVGDHIDVRGPAVGGQLVGGRGHNGIWDVYTLGGTYYPITRRASGMNGMQ